MPTYRRSRNVADTTHGLQLLVAIADGGSFTAAGAHLGLTPSAVSKAVTRVEARLGVRLLLRTTRSVAFTEAGEAYVARGRQLIADFEGLEREMSSRDKTKTMRGTLRVSAPTIYGSVKVAPLLVELARAHPELDVHLKCEDRLVDMVVERIDVAVRMMSVLPAVLAAHEAARGGLGIAELPDYLARDDVAAKSLREVLPGALPATRRIYALYLPSRYLPPQVRAFVDLLVRNATSRPS